MDVPFSPTYSPNLTKQPGSINSDGIASINSNFMTTSEENKEIRVNDEDEDEVILKQERTVKLKNSQLTSNKLIMPLMMRM
jgi:hypothetical protein